MPKDITGTSQAALDLTVTIPIRGDTSSAARFEAIIQALLNNDATLEGETISQIIAGTGLTGGGTSGTITIGVNDGGIGTTQIADDAVDASKLDTSNTGVSGQVLEKTSTDEMTWVDNTLRSVGDLIASSSSWNSSGGISGWSLSSGLPATVTTSGSYIYFPKLPPFSNIIGLWVTLRDESDNNIDTMFCPWGQQFRYNRSVRYNAISGANSPQVLTTSNVRQVCGPVLTTSSTRINFQIWGGRLLSSLGFNVPTTHDIQVHFATI